MNRANIPTFAYPDAAARTFTAMWQYSSNLRSLYETPTLEADTDYDRTFAERIVSLAHAAKRTVLTEAESKQLLNAYGIPTVETQVATSAEAAVAAANQMGYPVVLKLFSETITHKTDVGGVQLNLANDNASTSTSDRVEVVLDL